MENSSYKKGILMSSSEGTKENLKKKNIPGKNF